MVGWPKQVVGALIDWWAQGLVAGFNVALAVLPDDLGHFVDHVVPKQQAWSAVAVRDPSRMQRLAQLAG